MATENSSIQLVGVSHRTLSIETRELFQSIGPNTNSLTELAGDLGLSELAVISTCNRFELVWVGYREFDQVIETLHRRLSSLVPEEGFYYYRDGDAIRHLFRVAAGLDSMVVGETQIHSQLKRAYAASVDAKLTGKLLHHLFQAAFRVSKLVRSATEIGTHGVSVSYIAVKLAEQVFGELTGRHVLVIGSGEMAELSVWHLKRYGCSRVSVANRTLENALQLAEQFGGSAIPLGKISEVLSDVDVVISSLATSTPVLEVRQFSAKRREKPLFVIDLGVPRNIPSAVGEIEDLFLYNIDDLAEIAEHHRSLRDEAASDAEVIIEYALHQFESWLQRVRIQPELLCFRDQVAKACEQEILRSLKQLISPDLLNTIIPELSYRLSQKVLHVTSAMLRESNESVKGIIDSELELLQTEAAKADLQVEDVSKDPDSHPVHTTEP